MDPTVRDALSLRHLEFAGQRAGVSGSRGAHAGRGRLTGANLITSKGVEATQSVFHLYVHIVPRRDGDNLPLP
ncbi:HIT domain-containing protein [Streptomyces bacillaris]|uniref:HIT domain-containing protein n=1 Tax=Streptomyces bacillaris TaxID=68179 RepID=UPI00335E5BD5